MIIIAIFVIVLIIANTIFGIKKDNIKAKCHEDNKALVKEHVSSSCKSIARKRTIVNIVIVGIFGIITILNTIFFTNEQQTGFVCTFGNNSMIDTAGIHFKAPFISKKYVYDSTTQGMPIGYTLDTEDTDFEDAQMITSDINFINIDFYLEYRIIDPIAYKFSTSDPNEILRNIATTSIRNTVGLVDVDTALTTGKSQIENDVLADIQSELTKHNTGLSVSRISIQDSEPPTEKVNQAFKAVNDAKTGKDTAINEATSEAKKLTEEASAKAIATTNAAEVSKTERINQAKEEVAEFEAVYAEYKKNPEVVKERLYLDMIENVYPNMKIYIGDGNKMVYVSNDGVDVSGTSN